MESSYIKSAAKAQQLPEFDKPEIAFLGRSNCGKSTLLNSLLSRRSLARTSRTPGRTQMVNFFSWKNSEIETVIADLPGFGYSATGQHTRKHWEALMRAYVGRENISFFLFLSDSRRKLTKEDIELAKYISEKRPMLVILTKVDKQNRAELQKAKKKMKASLEENEIEFAGIHAVSCLKKTGIKALRDEIFDRLSESSSQ